MHKYLSLFQNKRFLITSLIICLLSVGLCFVFNDLIQKSYSGIKAWNNAESTYVAYDSRQFNDNCFVYYGKNLTFNIKQEKESIRLPSYSYQFIDGINYDARSLVNESNVLQGSFSKLADGEIAITKSLSDHYKKGIGDSFFLNGTKEYKIKYITADFYSIFDASINSDASSVFVGSSVELLGAKESYAVFDNVSREYNKVYSFKRIIDGFTSNFVVGLSTLSLIIVSMQTFALIFYRKEKSLSLNEIAISGNIATVNRDLMVMNLSIYILPFIASMIVSLIQNNLWILMILGGVSVLFFVLDSVITRLRVR